MRWVRFWGVLAASAAIVGSLVVAPQAAWADDWSTVPPCQYTLADGPLRVGCTAGLIPILIDPKAPPGSPTVEILAVASTDPSIVEAKIVTGQNPWGPNSIRILTKATGMAKVCYAYKARPGDEPATISSSDSRLGENCVDVGVGTDGEPNCHPKVLTPDGYSVETGHIHLGCTGYGMGCEGCVVTEAWTTNAAVLNTFIRPNPTPEFGGPPNTAAYEPVSPGKATVCWRHLPRPGIRQDDRVSCTTWSVHPLTANIADTVAYPKSANQFQCNWAEGATTAYLQVGCSVFGSVGPGGNSWTPISAGTTFTSSNPAVMEAIAYESDGWWASVVALRAGTSEVCRRDAAGAQVGPCVTVTVVNPDVDVANIALRYPPTTGTPTSSSASSSSATPSGSTDSTSGTSGPLETTVLYASGTAQIRVSEAKASAGSITVRLRAPQLTGLRGTVTVKRRNTTTGRLQSVVTKQVRFDRRGAAQATVSASAGDLLVLADGKGRRVAVVQLRS